MSTLNGSFRIASEVSGKRLDIHLAGLFPEESRSSLQKWIRHGIILVNNSPVKSGYKLKIGDTVTFHPQAQPHKNALIPEKIPLSIVYEDDDLAVIEKPAGMVSHAGAGIRSGTLVNALLFHFGPFQAGDPSRPGIVHRLDKMTSGLMVVAKNPASHRNLSRQFKERSIRKEYLALVYGHPLPIAGTLSLPLGRDTRDRKKISVHARRRRDAITHYVEERKIGSFSLLRIRIETGRTHQIRVHLAQKGYPVAGDELYGGNRFRSLPNPRLRKEIQNLKRHFLHANRLEFAHPRSGRVLVFESPLPQDLASFLATAADLSAQTQRAGQAISQV